MSLTVSDTNAESPLASWAEAAALLDTILQLVDKLPVDQKEKWHWEQMRPQVLKTLELIIDHAIAEEPPDGQD